MMDAIPYEERLRLSDGVPALGQRAVMAKIPAYSEVPLVNAYPAPDAHPETIRAIVFNMERGQTLDETCDFVCDCPGFQNVDIILANELDNGNVRSGCRDVAQAISERIGMNYCFGLEFIELVNPDDVKGYHGNAIFSRWPIKWAKTLYLPEEYNWYYDRQKRIGCRLAILAMIEVDGRDVGAVCVHLENRTDSDGRARQTKAILDEIERVFPKGCPIIMGGDFNTNTFDGDSVAEFLPLYEAQKAGEPMRDVAQYERTLPLVEEYGYDYRSFNLDKVTTRRKPMRDGGDLELQLDWLFVRGMQCAARGVISTKQGEMEWAKPGSALAAFEGRQLSDHNAVWADCY